MLNKHSDKPIYIYIYRQREREREREREKEREGESYYLMKVQATKQHSNWKEALKELPQSQAYKHEILYFVFVFRKPDINLNE